MKCNLYIPKPLVAGVITAELASAVLAWRDLAHRRVDQGRGAKTGWHTLLTLNSGNSIAYWALGRR